MVSPTAFRTLVKEITQLRTAPPEGIRIVTNEENILDLTAIIAGPEGTPYAGGYFHVRFAFGDEFPAAPPRATMATKIFHPNVSRAGEICVNTLKKDWKPTYGIAHILVTIKCLLIHPNPESALDEESGKLLLEDWDEFCGRARMWTSVHATPKVPPAEFNTPSKAAPVSIAPVIQPTPPSTATTTKSKLDSTTPPPTVQAPLQPSAANNAVPTAIPASVPGQNAAGTENGNIIEASKETTVPATKTKRPATSGVDKKKKALKRL